MVTRRQNLAPVRPGKNCSGYGNGKKFITVHQTGNTNKGANAQMHANLQTRVWDASWHWQVDDKEAIQSFPHTVKCWHASDGERGDGNANSIGVEGCINSDGDYKKAVQNMAELVAWIAKEESIPVANIKQHHDFARDKKNCPTQIRSGKEGINWSKFIQMVQAELDKLNGKIKVDSAKVHKVAKGDTLWSVAKKYGVSVDYLKSINSLKSDLIIVGQSLKVAGLAPKPTQKPVSKPADKPNLTAGESYKEKGTFYPNDTIIVRDQPTTKATTIARYYNGEHVDYHTVHKVAGYVWLQYNRAKGKQGYIPCREYQDGKYGPLWGSIK